MDTFEDKISQIFSLYESEKKESRLEQYIALFSQKNVVLFGAAVIGDIVYEKLLSFNIQPVAFADNFCRSKLTPNGHGPILHPNEILQSYTNCIFIITNDRAKQVIYEQLLSMGVSSADIVVDIQPFMSTMTLSEIRSHIDGCRWAYNFFSDDISKQIILDRLSCYLLGTEVSRSNSPQYFEKNLFRLTSQEVFVDGGFFDGDTSIEFIKQTHNCYKKIYAFEPDCFVREKMPPSLNNANIEIIPCALYSHSGTISFSSTQGTSNASGGTIVEAPTASNDICNIPTISLDEYFSDIPIENQPTYIKMDIEGAEQKALEGASRLISNSKPKLAICVYHKPEDIYSLTQYIHSLCPDYNFALRHYAHYFWETVLYAF